MLLCRVRPARGDHPLDHLGDAALKFGLRPRAGHLLHVKGETRPPSRVCRCPACRFGKRTFAGTGKRPGIDNNVGASRRSRYDPTGSLVPTRFAK